jgi:hypothetical protein
MIWQHHHRLLNVSEIVSEKLEAAYASPQRQLVAAAGRLNSNL